MNNSWKFFTKVTSFLQNTILEAKSQCYNSFPMFYRGDNVSENDVSIRPIFLIYWGQLNVSFADCSGLQSRGAYTFSVFSGVCTILTLLPGFLFITEVVVWNFSFQFLMVLLSGTFTCLSVIKCFLNTNELLLQCHYFWKMSWCQTHSQHPTIGTCFY